MLGDKLPLEGGMFFMPAVKVRQNEPFEAVLRRFKKQCEKAGILTEIKKREHYDKPSVKKKKKIIAARKKIAKLRRSY